jgi:membrane protein
LISLLAATGLALRSGQPRPALAGAESKPEGNPGARAVDFARAAEACRGRDASSPLEIPWRGWRDIVLRTYREVDEDRLLAVAGGVVFFILLAVFPSITAFVSLYGIFASPASVSQDLAPLFNFAPSDAVRFLIDEVQRIAAKSNSTLSLASTSGVLFALWSANAGTKAIFDALNVACGEKEKRGFVRLNLISFAFTIGALFLLLVAVGAVVAVPLVLSRFGLLDTGEILLSLLRWPLLFLVSVAALSVLYRYGPSRTEAKWRWLTVGSVAATLLWLIASALFSWYLANFADYNGTYGSLGAAIGLMMWLWIAVIVILAGAELDAEIEHQTARDSTVGAEKPLGARGATMADTIGAAQD